MSDLSKEFSEFKLELTQQLNQNKHELQESFNQSSVDIRKEISLVRNHVINLLLKENKGLRERCKTLESRVVTNEKRLNKLEQNHRKSNFELDGIPANVRHEDLSKTVTDIVNTIVDEKVSVQDVEACHRLPSKRSPAPTIIRMKRNIIDDVWKNKKKLAEVAQKLNFPPNTKIYANPNMSPSMRSLHFHARKLKKDGKITDAWYSNAAVRIKHLDGTTARIEHEMDLYDQFQQYEFDFDTSLYDRVLNPDVEDYEHLYDYDDHRDNLTHSKSKMLDEILEKLKINSSA